MVSDGHAGQQFESFTPVKDTRLGAYGHYAGPRSPGTSLVDYADPEHNNGWGNPEEAANRDLQPAPHWRRRDRNARRRAESELG